MKTFAIAAIALASVATAQLDNIPSCALNCFIGPLTSDGCSSLTDFKCHCEKGASLISQVTPCVEGACSASDQAATISAVQSTCEQAGAPIVIPDPSGAASSAAAPATSAAASSAAEAASSAIASVVSSIAAEVSSAVVVPSASHTSNSSAPTGASPSPSQFTGGAAQATQAAAVLGAAALALFAL